MSFLQEGLTHVARRDMVCEEDGAALVAMWKIHMAQLWSLGHTHYKSIAHQFLAFVSGVMPERIRHELVWERLVNQTGGPGRNKGLDFANECLNNQFKEMITAARGRYTTKQIERCAKMVGGFGKELEGIFTTTICDSDFGDDGHATPRKLDMAQLRRFVRDYEPDQLVTFVPNRLQPTLPTLNQVSIKRPFELGRFLKKQSMKVDKFLNIAKETARRERANHHE